MVVGVSHLVLVAVSQLLFDPVSVVAEAVQLGAEQMPEAVAGLPILVEALSVAELVRLFLRPSA